MEKKFLPSIKKNIASFLSSEEGRISKKKIAKIGLGLAVLSLLLDPAVSAAQHQSWHQSHSTIENTPVRGRHDSHQSHGSHASHGSHGSHSSHGSHGSHSSHGSHASHCSHNSW